MIVADDKNCRILEIEAQRKLSYTWVVGDMLDTVVTLRRAARVWPPLDRLLRVAVPDQIDLTDADVKRLRSTIRRARQSGR